MQYVELLIASLSVFVILRERQRPKDLPGKIGSSKRVNASGAMWMRIYRPLQHDVFWQILRWLSLPQNDTVFTA